VFGKDAEGDHDCSILTFKKFTDLPYTHLLSDGKGENKINVWSYLDRWLQVARDTYYKDLLMRILKSVYVYVSSKDPPQSLNKGTYKWINQTEVQKPPRIDKLSLRKIEMPGEAERLLKFPELKNAKMNKTLEAYKQRFDYCRQEARILSSDINHRTIVRNHFNRPEQVTNVATDLTISKIRKRNLLNGSGQIKPIYNTPGSKMSYYQENFKGWVLKYDNPRMDKDHFASTLLSLSPDPQTLARTIKRNKNHFQTM
jgi:hypothetical protein